MTTFEDLHWESLLLVKKHLYRRLATPLNNALGRMAIARHVTNPSEAREQYKRVEYNLDIALNLVKAWAALVHVMGGGAIRQSQRRQLSGLPAWLIQHLNTQTSCVIEHTQPVVVHPETFYESIQLMCLITAGAGTLKRLTTGDAPNDESKIWIRAAFEPPASGLFASLGDLYRRLDVPTPAEQELMFQLRALQELCRINGMTLRLQNNRRTGEQALAASVPAVVRSGSAVSAPAQASADKTQEALAAPLMNGLAGQPTNGTRKPAGEVKSTADSAHDPLEEIPDIDNQSDTLIVPPPNFREELLARAQEARQNAADPVENQADTLIVPPPDFSKRSSRDAESDAPVPEPRRPGTGVFTRPPAPGVIEVVEPENAADMLIAPPPDYKRRVGLSHPLSRPSSHYSSKGDQSEGQDKAPSTE